MSFSGMSRAISEHYTSRIFFFDDPTRGIYFWKQFIAGIFMAIAINGLDQDMMQRNLACRNFKECRKNMLVSAVMQLVIIALFLLLGTMLVIYIEHTPSLHIPDKTDEIFGLVATDPSLPIIVGILFIVGLVAAAYSAAGSALVSLTTSFTIDILGHRHDEADARRLARVRRSVHVLMALIMALIIIVFYLINEDDAISAVYTLASYTYGPILGLFAFGIFSKRRVNDALVPVVCIAAPILCYVIKYALHVVWNYEVSFELLLLNAIITCAGLFLIPERTKSH
jgi:Na+/proline symporter